MSQASALGAVTIINATATGHGCSLAIDAPTTAQWTWTGADLAWLGATDDRLAAAVLACAQDVCGEQRGARIDARSPFPPARGLKTSSAAAAAMMRAALADAGQTLGSDAFDQVCVQAALDAGVTLTGAFDDHVAVTRGGCHIADNRHRRIEASLPVPSWHVAVWVPQERIGKGQLASIDPGPARPQVQHALAVARSGDLPRAMEQAGQAYLRLYAAAGLPVTNAPVQAARAAGALGAGLSGTGPAVAAIFEERADLPAVAGGTWHWHRALAEVS